MIDDQSVVIFYLLKMVSLLKTMLICICILLSIFKSVKSIYCYQCYGTDSNNPFECNEFLDSDNDLVATDCSTIHNAQYCIKHVGRFEGISINCYQCKSSDNMECGDGLMNLDGGILKPQSCEHVFNAQYCIKITGGISTKRYCSHLDLGNYCNYVQQPGDKLEYRTCIYTCGTDGCNYATSINSTICSIIWAVIFSLFIL